MAVDDLPCEQLVEQVTDYLEGALDPAACARFEAHLAVCDGCGSYLEQVRQTVQLLSHLPPEHLSDTSRQRVVEAFRSWRAGGPADT